MDTVYLLIDTNCWIDLCTKVPEKQLDLFESWIEKNSVSLLIPEQLMLEWTKAKDEQLKARKKTHAQISEDVGPYSQLLNGTYKYYESKSNRIDKLILRGIQFQPTTDARAESMKHFEQRKAPFHHKNNNSNADALIYLSTIDYLKTRSISEFYFISRDTDDFGDPMNCRQLHPDLKFPEISVHFYCSIIEGIYKLSQEIGTVEAETEHKVDYVPPYVLAKDLDKLSPTDQLYESLRAYYDQIPFIPANILSKVFPFKITNGTHSYSRYSNFRISSNNKEIVKLFKCIIIDEENSISFRDSIGAITSEEIDKLSDILKKLNYNLIFDISSIDKTEQADIRLHQKHICTCVSCSFNRLDFYQSLSDLKSDSSLNSRQLLKHAYIHFQFGHFETAMRLYYSTYEKAKSQDKHILSFICLYNLKELVYYVEAFFLKPSAETTILIEKIKTTSIQDYGVHYFSEPPFVRDTIKWIAERSFYTHAFERITQAVDEIRDHYYQQLNGGWTNSGSYVKLVSAFAEIDEFLNQNCIIYNNYA
ncbi:MAG: PIN domain-containing protein, partial [Chitinophagaceae bacterium]